MSKTFGPEPSPARRYQPGMYRGEPVLVRVDPAVAIGEYIRTAHDGDDLQVDAREVTLIRLPPRVPSVLRRTTEVWTEEREALAGRLGAENPLLSRAALARLVVDAFDGRLSYKQVYGKLAKMGLPRPITGQTEDPPTGG